MRIPRHQMFMEIAQVVAKRSTCFRESVGAIIVKDKRIISIGYNGPASGKPPCTFHLDGKCAESIHAEENAMLFASLGPSLKNRSCDLYVTHLPCPNCTELIIKSGMFKRVFFQIMYGASEPIHARLDYYGIKLLRVMPSGIITSHDRMEILDVQT